jgi:predicted small lipoprotein YifL
LNFKLILLVFLVSACGVKGDPAIPKSNKIPSLLDNYPDIQTDKSLDDAKKAHR